jgi:5'-3' exonuclease
VERYPGYKTTRQPDPEALPPQFDLLRELLDAMGQPQAEAPGWEADDAIGALCAMGNPDDRFDIVTGDRDLIQLVRDPLIRVLYTLRGVSQLAELDEEAVLARYGVPSSRYADFAVLRGDPSDGLPGVPGVGEKTARALVSAYPSLDALAADAAADRPEPPLRSPRLREAILGSAGYLGVMREVVPIRTDVEVRTWAEPMDEGRVDELAARHRLAGPIRRLRLSLDLLPHPGPPT